MGWQLLLPPPSWDFPARFTWELAIWNAAVECVPYASVECRGAGSDQGSQTLKEATDEAFRDYIATSDHTHYLIGSVVGPHPYPMIVRDLQSIIGRELRQQMLEAEGKLPQCIIACVRRQQCHGCICEFLSEPAVRLVGVEQEARVWTADGILLP